MALQIWQLGSQGRASGPAPGGRFQVWMRVREDLHALVRTDSVAAVLTDGLLGAGYIQIRAGTESAPEVADGGTLSGATRRASCIQAHSYELRSTGASQRAATLRRGRARFTQTGPPGNSTRQMSDETPPASGAIAGTASCPTSPMRRSAATIGARPSVPASRTVTVRV